MTVHFRLLAALLLASASSALVACGDDGGGGDDDEDSGSDAGTGDEDGGDDAGPDDGGTGGGDGGGTGGDGGPGGGDGGDDAGPLPSECPEHPNVASTGDYCVITAPLGNEITEDLTLEPIEGKEAFILSKSVFVGEDVGAGATPASGKKRVTLTIKPGTKVLGADNLSFLLINRGSKIMAEGTKDNPVVFGSGSTGAARPGRWGGVVINGRAPTNLGADVNGEAGTGKYGGPDEDDDSGKIRYVRIEFGGGKVDDVNELNGLALQGVGRGTELDYIHIHGNDDDGIEFFGGTVNAKHIITTGASDDGIDWTNGWTGKLQYAIAQAWDNSNPGTGANNYSNGVEADNNETMPTQAPVSAPTLSNITLIGSDSIAKAHGMILRRGTQGKLHNFLILNFGASCISLRGTASAGFAGDELAILNSRMFCETSYDTPGNEGGPAAGTAEAPDPTAAQAMWEASGADNEALADKDSSLTDPYSHEPDFTPKDGSGLLTGGAKPDDAFFDDVDFIGAIGEEDWTEGEWFKVTEF